MNIACYQVLDTAFVVDKRYEIRRPMNSGAYGTVCSAHDTETGQMIAIKKIEGVFDHLTMTKRTLRELRILRHLQHENLSQMKNIFVTQNKIDFNDIYVVSDLMETDMASMLKTSQVLSDLHCQFFIYQLLRGMKYVHSAQVIHRDLKPRNLLVNSNCDLKICDFGLARVCFSTECVCHMTEYVCTRWYRAPEVLCSWTDYSCSIDVWSIGCIFAEIMTRRSLFPGANTQHQLDLIIGLLGSPAAQELEKIPNEKCRKFLGSLSKTPRTPFCDVFSNSVPAAQDLVAQMLRWDPRRRLSVADAIQHEYLETLHCMEDEPVRDPLDTTDFEFERRKINQAVLREEIFRETLQYHPELLKQFEQEESASSSRYNISQYRLLEPGESQYSSDEGDSD